MKWLKKIITNMIDWFLYSVLSEKQKEKLTNLFSEEQKEWIKRFTQYGKKHAQKAKVKKIKDNLYSLGLTDEALAEFKHIFEHDKDKYLKRLVAWELTLWYTNQYTETGAKRALEYIEYAKLGEKDVDQLRRIAIIEAECLARIGKKEEARTVLEKNLQQRIHPDVYLAIANLEDSIEERLYWINKVYSHFNLNPITFSNLTNPHYDGLQMEQWSSKKHENSKVSVILPAYNAEEGVQIAIESILSQTWQNLELIIVDDCSTDNTFQVVKAYEEKDERVKVFSTPQNSGPYVARNIALQHATGDFVTVNDADDWSHEKKIEVQVTHLLENPSIIANTSAHARLTEEDLLLYRRGTPGRYIFPNMSSMMFRRKPVVEKLGYWDSVRFAADGEFKRRVIKTFGKDKYVDLDSGPLSLPRQSVSSLTGSSAFGYNGFFMGARKEYVESLEFYHENNELYYPYPLTERLFPVPEPMWPQKEEKTDGKRVFDVVIAADFRTVTSEDDLEVQEIKKQLSRLNGGRIGLVQLNQFDLSLPIHISPIVRALIDGENLQMLVYGEKIDTEKLLIMDYNLIGKQQQYVPIIHPNEVEVMMKHREEDVKAMNEKVNELFQVQAKILPLNKNVRATLEEEELAVISRKDWVVSDE